MRIEKMLVIEKERNLDDYRGGEVKIRCKNRGNIMLRTEEKGIKKRDKRYRKKTQIQKEY